MKILAFLIAVLLILPACGSSADKDLAALRSEVASMRSEIASLRGQLAGSEQQVFASAELRLGDLRRQVDVLSNSNLANANAIGRIERDQVAMRRDLADARRDLTDTQKNITSSTGYSWNSTLSKGMIALQLKEKGDLAGARLMALEAIASLGPYCNAVKVPIWFLNDLGDLLGDTFVIGETESSVSRTVMYVPRGC